MSKNTVRIDIRKLNIYLDRVSSNLRKAKSAIQTAEDEIRELRKQAKSLHIQQYDVNQTRASNDYEKDQAK